MIQINLIPDVKDKYIKAQRKKRLVMLSSFSISAVFLGIFLILVFIVYGAQKIQLNLLDKDIKSNSQKLQKIESLDKILTVQNQLNSLTALHQSKPVTSRIYDFLPQITPTNVEISRLQLDYETSSIKTAGTASSLEAVNKFVDTLKFTEFITDKSTDKKLAFSEVVLTNFGIKDKGATYTIKLKFDPIIFSSEATTVTLIVPSITSTRSQTEQPDLFKAQPKNGKAE